MRLMVILTIMVICPMTVAAQAVPQDTTNAVMVQKIAQEHQNTRKFFSDELTRQRTEFFKQMDDRFNYYEKTADSFLTTTAIKLGLMWGGIVVLVLGLYSVFRVRLDKKKNKRFNDTIAQLIKVEVAKAVNLSETKQPQNLNQTNQERTEQFFGGAEVKRPVIPNQRPLHQNHEYPNTGHNPFFMEQQPPAPPKQPGFFQRRREKKALKILKKLERQETQIQKQKDKVVGSIFTKDFAPPEQQQQPHAQMSFDYEANY